MGLGSKLKTILDMKGVRVATLANDLGLNKTTLYSLIQRDSDKMDMDTLARIADYLGVSLDCFFMQTNEEALAAANAIQVSVKMNMVVSISADEYSTLTKLRTLDEHGKQLVNTVLELEYERCSTAGQLPDHLDNGEVDEQIAQSEKLHKSLDKCTRSGA